MKFNYVEAKLDKSQNNSKCKLCDEKDETVNYVRECSKLAQKEYKCRHDRGRKVIH